MKYLDLVELVTDREEYKKEGLRKGMFGAVMTEEPIQGQWQVVFSEFYTGSDIADIFIREEDLTRYDKLPPEKLPSQK